MNVAAASADSLIAGTDVSNGASSVTAEPNADVILRAATWHDIATLTRLDAELFEHEAWAESTWWDEFAARPRRQYVVAERPLEPSPESDPRSDTGIVPSRSEIVGYAGLDAGGSTADVMTIAVTPSARGTGLGRRLLDHLVSAATATGAEALLLEVRADNAPALTLYETSGFDRLSVRRRYYQPGDVDAVIMRKLLKETP